MMQHSQNNSDAVTIIITFGVLGIMFIALLIEKMGNGELVDW